MKHGKRVSAVWSALAVGVLALLVVAVAGCGGDSGTTSGAAAAGGKKIEAWTTPNGEVFNHREANSQIDAANVDQLGVAWKLPIDVSLDNTFVPAAKFGEFASTPVFDGEGTVYFQDAANNVTAASIETGLEKWKRVYNLPNEGPNGVTYDNGVIYGATSTFAFALDAKTGEQLWRTPRLVITEAEGEAQFPEAEKVGGDIKTEGAISPAGQGINFAPQVNDGKVFLSTSGQITGGEAIALDAKSGEVLWKTDETKEPEDRAVGGTAGTAGSWNAPAIAPDGTVYYGIGNPYRTDDQAIKTPTELLYNDSTIALDPETGKVKWYYQGVPNDFYDWDMQISPVYVEEDGDDIVLDAGKMGYVYAMDAGSGKLLWKTPVGIHNGHDEDGKLALEGKYHPTKYPYKVYPGTLGGVETNMAESEGVAYVPVVNSYQERPDPSTTLGGGQSLDESTGAMAAIEVSTGEKLWETELHQPSFGAATVSNDLVFTTLYDGTVVGLSREDGSIVWEEELPGGSNSPLVIERGTLIAINSVPTGTAKPQIVAWRLGASGAVNGGVVEPEGAEGEAEEPAAEPEPEEAEPKPAPEPEEPKKPAEPKPEAGAGGDEAQLTMGKTAFTTNCAGCHTLSEAGTTGSVGPNLDDLMPDFSLVVKQVTNGGGGMPAFGGILTKAEIEAIAKYVSTVAGTGDDSLGGASTGGGGGV
jgi:outer membrane protein assembly factor BamB/mono/diheme cytochrome c family protein